MSRMRIDGKKIAQDIIDKLRRLPKPNKMLAAVLVGDNSRSKSFLKQKEMIAGELKIPFHLYQYGEAILEDDLIKEVKKLNDDPEIGGIIIQLPLPRHYNRDRILSAVDPKKDIDALTPESRQFVDPLPVEVVNDVLGSMNYKLSDKAIAVVGKGFLVGKPIIDWLNGNPSTGSGQKCKTLLIFDSKSDLSGIKKSDLIITGVGKAGLIKPEMLKSGAAVIDFGYSIGVESEKGKAKSRIFGDFDASNVNGQMSNVVFYTPTPGGTGPILVAEIFKNFYKLAGH